MAKGRLGSQTLSTAAHILSDFCWQNIPYRSHGGLGVWLSWLPSTQEGWIRASVLHKMAMMVLLSTAEVEAEGSGVQDRLPLHGWEVQGQPRLSEN